MTRAWEMPQSPMMDRPTIEEILPSKPDVTPRIYARGRAIWRTTSISTDGSISLAQSMQTRPRTTSGSRSSCSNSSTSRSPRANPTGRRSTPIQRGSGPTGPGAWCGSRRRAGRSRPSSRSPTTTTACGTSSTKTCAPSRRPSPTRSTTPSSKHSWLSTTPPPSKSGTMTGCCEKPSTN